MTCPVCNTRPAKRQCPALGRQICAVCCATKRFVEIRCPSDCGYLAASRKHPAAVTKRRHEHDVMLLMPAMAEMTDRQSRFFFLFQSIVARYPSDALRPLVDADVAEAAGSVAQTLETSSRGVIYESSPQSLTAQELARELRRAFEEIVAELKGPRSPLERDAAKALGGIAEAARRVGAIEGNERQGFLELIRRVLRPAPDAADRPATGDSGPGIIVTGT
jgi:hypothetical protein